MFLLVLRSPQQSVRDAKFTEPQKVLDGQFFFFPSRGGGEGGEGEEGEEGEKPKNDLLFPFRGGGGGKPLF